MRELLLEQQGLCALCGTPIEAATAEADHVVPVHQAFYGQRQALQALCLECHRQDLPGVLPRHEPGEPVLPLCPRDLRLLASAAAAGLRAGEVRSDGA